MKAPIHLPDCGDVYTWGFCKGCGHRRNDVLSPELKLQGRQVVQVAGGATHSLALTSKLCALESIAHQSFGNLLTSILGYSILVSFFFFIILCFCCCYCCGVFSVVIFNLFKISLDLGISTFPIQKLCGISSYDFTLFSDKNCALLSGASASICIQRS